MVGTGVTKNIWRTVAGGVFFGVLPLLAGWKFNIAGMALTGPAAYAAAAAIGVLLALVIRFSMRRGVRE